MARTMRSKYFTQISIEDSEDKTITFLMTAFEKYLNNFGSLRILFLNFGNQTSCKSILKIPCCSVI